MKLQGLLEGGNRKALLRLQAVYIELLPPDVDVKLRPTHVALSYKGKEMYVSFGQSANLMLTFQGGANYNELTDWVGIPWTLSSSCIAIIKTLQLNMSVVDIKRQRELAYNLQKTLEEPNG